MAVPGNTEVELSWDEPEDDGGDEITDYVIEYKLADSVEWETFDDGVSTNTSVTITDLTNNEEYDFRVYAVNSTGTSVASETASATPTPPTAPNPPTDVTAVAGNTQATISFSAPLIDGGSDITAYTVTSSPGNITAEGNASPITITGLTNGVEYTFTVTATNAVGTSEPSAASNAVTPSLFGVILSDNFTGTTINTTKWNEFDSAGAGGSSGDIQQNGSLSIANSFVGGNWYANSLTSVEEFDSDSLEFSAVMTANSSQFIGFGEPDFQDPNNKAYLLYRTGAGTAAIWALAWTEGDYEVATSCGNGIQGAEYTLKIIETGFEIYVNDALRCSIEPGFTIDSGHVFMQVQANASTFDDVEVLGFDTPDSAPDAPTIGTATAGNGRATVTFTPPASDGGSSITGYTVISSPGNLTAEGNASPITLTGLTNGVEYTFTVTATNAIGTSESSAASNAVTPSIPEPPEPVTGLELLGTNRQVLLNWTEPDPGGEAISDYIVEYKEVSEGEWTTFEDGESTELKSIVTGLENDTEYMFRVSAANSGGAGEASESASATPDEIETLAFVITGESNSGGIGLNSDATPNEIAARSSVQIMDLTSGEFDFEDLDIGVNNLRDHAGLSAYYDNSHGFELQLANSAEAHAFPDNEQVHLIKTGQGGSTISQWNTGGTYWNKHLERTAAAKNQLSENRQWVVWLSIGINDAIAGTNTATWKTAMVAHIDKLKTDLPGAIVILTQFQSMSSGSGYPTFNAVMEEIAEEEANVFAVDTTGASLRDGNHWSYAGLKTVASSMVNVTKEKLGFIYPGKPTDLSVEGGVDQAELSWSAPVANGGSAITDYRIEYKLDAASDWSVFADATSTATGATITGLSDGENYNFRVSAVNTNGHGNYTSTTSQLPDATSPVISNVSVTSQDNGGIITWQTNELASSQIEYGLDSNYGNETIETNITPRVTNHSVSLNEMLPCTSYYFRIKSTDGASNQRVGSLRTLTTTGCEGSSEVLEENSQTIDATGGNLELKDSGKGINLIIPSGFTGTSANFQIKKLEIAPVMNTTSRPVNYAIIGNYLYNLRALSGISTPVSTFDNAITITVTYSEDDLDGMDETTLVIYRWDGNSWNALPDCNVDTNANTVTCSTIEFSIFGLFGVENTSAFVPGNQVKFNTHIPIDIEYCIFSEYILDLYEKKIVRGYSDSTFRPDNYVTRGEMAKMVVNALQLETVDSGDSFPDVTQDSIFRSYIRTLKMHNIVTGFEDGSFLPDQPITRGETTAIIVRALEAKGYSLSDEPATYLDLSEQNPHYESISKLSNTSVNGESILSGYSDHTFRPDDYITRGQMAKVVALSHELSSLNTNGQYSFNRIFKGIVSRNLKWMEWGSSY